MWRLEISPARHRHPAVTNPFTTPDGIRLGVQTIVTNVEIPWSMAFAPDGRLFFTERAGRVRIYQNNQLLPAPALTLEDVRHVGEGGLMGIALHPQFASNRFVYLLYTANASGGMVNRAGALSRNEQHARRSRRAARADDREQHPQRRSHPVRSRRPAVLTMGDAANTSLSQTLSSLNGKILRVDENGIAAGGNPFGSEIWTWGHRNPQGLDWNPSTGDLWATEHGASGNDEINRLQPGRNYGWPVIEGAATRPDMETPAQFFSPSIAPSGGSFHNGSRIAGLRNNFFFGALTGQHIRRVILDPANPTRIASTERWLNGEFGRIRDVVLGPDGALYFCTNNRDGRGAAAASDDRIARIIPQ